MILQSREAIFRREAIFQDIDNKPKGVSKVCNANTPSQKSVFSFQLGVNTMLIKNGSHWLEKNLLLDEGFDKSMNKI